MFGTTVFTTLAFATTALAFGQAIVKNKCGAPIWITSVDSAPHETISVAASGTWSEPQRYDPATGIDIKIGTTPDALYTGKPVLHFAYTAHPDPWLYYSLSTTYGYDALFQGKKLALEGSADDAMKIVWDGTPSTPPDGTKAHNGELDLILTLCA